jgi:hypothetical protein
LKRDEVTGDCRKLYNEELHNFHSSPSIVRMVESRRMRWAEHVAHMGEKWIDCIEDFDGKAKRKETTRKN